jgi:hypothetical protein
MAPTPLSLPYYTTVRASHRYCGPWDRRGSPPEKTFEVMFSFHCPREKVWSNHIPRDCSDWEAGRSLFVIPQ